MQLECSISITTDDGKKHYLQRDAPIILYDSHDKKIGEGNIKGVSFALKPFEHKIGNIEIVGVATYNAMKKTLCSISVSDIEKIEVVGQTINIYVKCVSTVIY